MTSGRKAHARPFRGALFDLDGTLLDTETPCVDVIDKVVRQYLEQREGVASGDVSSWSWTDAKHAGIVGMRAVDWTRVVLLDAGLLETSAVKVESQEMSEMQQKLTEDWEKDLGEWGYNRADWLPGAEALTAKLHDELGIPMCIATSSNKSAVAKKRAARDGKNKRVFDRFGGCIVTGEDVSRGKPDPEIFAKAAAMLGLSPDECIAFEDSPLGCDSARAAGCYVVAVPGRFGDPKNFEGRCDLILADKGLHDFLTQGHFQNAFGEQSVKRRKVGEL